MVKKKKDKKLSEKQRLAKELDDIILNNIKPKSSFNTSFKQILFRIS